MQIPVFKIKKKPKNRIIIEKQLIANVLIGMYSVRFNGGASSQESTTQVQSAPHHTLNIKARVRKNLFRLLKLFRLYSLLDWITLSLRGNKNKQVNVTQNAECEQNTHRIPRVRHRALYDKAPQDTSKGALEQVETLNKSTSSPELDHLMKRSCITISRPSQSPVGKETM